MLARGNIQLHVYENISVARFSWQIIMDLHLEKFNMSVMVGAGRASMERMESKSSVSTYCRLEDGDLLLERSDIKQMQYGFEILKCCPMCNAKCKSKHLKLHMKREHQGKAAGKPEFRRTGMSMSPFMY